jgi:hypothetical protein
MSISIGGFTFNRLIAQPFGYEETETSRGFTAKRWAISGLATPAEWVTLLGVYDTWRDARITEDDPVVSNSTGTTVTFSGTGAGGVTWNTPCWFSTAPQGTQDGIYISISVELVDAAQALAVLKATATSSSSTTTLAGTVTIGGVSFSRMTAQTSGYDETDTRRGFTAKRWSVTGLLTSAEWASLLSVYDSWRDLKIAEDDPLVTNSVGATVAISGAGVNGTNWSATCWFSGAPQGDPDQSGSYISASVELVDATQALAVLVAANAEDGGGGDIPPDLGTVTVGSAVLTLKKPRETFQSVPTLELTAAGTSYITGPRKAVEVEDIEGETDEAGWNAVRDWFKTTMESTPDAGDWYPISVPTASVERRIVSGSPQNIYTVSLQRAKAR